MEIKHKKTQRGKGEGKRVENRVLYTAAFDKQP